MDSNFEPPVALIEQLPKGPVGPSALSRLVHSYSQSEIQWAILQRDLRTKARQKFTDPSEMLFMSEALEQATHEKVANYHAQRFPVGATVYDMTTGIGADLRALASRGPAVGYELEEERAQLARWNTRGLESEVVCGDSLDALPEFAQYAYADPARRVAGRRTLDASAFQPDPTLLAERFRDLKLGLIKLTPMLSDDILTGLGQGVTFVSFGGECREALVECGGEAFRGVRAVHLESGTSLTTEDVRLQSTTSPDAWIFDCDPALVRSHGLSQFGLPNLGDHPGYLTGPDAIDSVWLRKYLVLQTGTWHAKEVRQAIRERGIEKAILKQRGSQLELEDVRKSLKLGHGGTHAIIFYHNAKSVAWTLVQIH